MTLKRGFAPVAGANTRLLILGSLPGDASLAASEYYAHPRNAFWRLVGEVAGRELASLPYPSRLEALRELGIGLWDVIVEARRAGSLDSAIRTSAEADLENLVAGLPALRAVAFNGGFAARTGRRRLASSVADLALIDLPSSSPAHARPFAQKLAAWAALRPWLNRD